MLKHRHMKKIQYLSLLSLLLLPLGFSTSQAQVFDKNVQKIQMAWQLVNTFYVDSIDQEKMGEEAVIGMLKTLDPHSTYISAKEVAAMNEPLVGSFEGVGIEFNIHNDTLVVVNPISGGPCEKVGIKAGDRILSINDTLVAGIGLKNSDVMKKLRGPKGTKVNMTIQRREQSELLLFVVTRDKIPLYSIDAVYMATPTIGYIKVNRFSATTSEEFTKAINQLASQKAESLIIDLRGNSGGYLNAAIDMADELLDNRKLIVYTQGLNNPRRDNNATAKGNFEKGRVVVLIDEGSASASEIVAGAIQDWDRGVIMGRRSFGKGLVQRPFTLPDGAVIRLTVAKYYTPAGRCIQKPYEEGRQAYQDELAARLKRGELTHRDSIHTENMDIHYTQLSKRKVYGGGGIMPDIFIPADTSQFSQYYRQLFNKGIINHFVITTLDVMRNDLEKQYPTFDVFNKEFTVGQNLTNQLIEYAKKEGIDYDDADFKKSQSLITSQIKALFARDLWSSAEYFQIMNPLMDTYNEAIKILEEKNKYNEVLKGNK
ncbi:carboxyl-terminal processing protease [Breznakibacter xylanolyticus]|uniref:Carboxyl-terminal processing protease n=2 Tax=Breznakibacter xylanolyticus TaxID=990 RepID=A0A2W7P3E9_9BACT|nr:carboxyl-terminal processing protease [Breznakibacter xylanolyticus]